jgi:hypothetical protein
MTCYFRHIRQIFEKAGIRVTNENKRQIDKVIHSIVGVEYKNCPVTWRELKSEIAKGEEAFISKLKEEFARNV